MEKKEAMKILKDFHDKSALFSVRTALDVIIPELKGNEDEDIKKAILELVRQSSEVLDKQNQNNMIAWLEKQGEERTINYSIEGMFPYTEPADTLDGEIENIWNKLRNCDNTFTAAKSGFYEVIHHFANWLEKQSYTKKDVDDAYLKGICHTKHELEKQGEQESADKHEPKFKNGQWIVWQNKCYKVNYNGCGYGLIDQNGLSTSLEYGTVDKSASAFTIKDAKDGDVLACDINKAEIGGDVEKLPNITPTICIYQNVVKDKDYIHSYSSLYDGSSLVLQNTMYYNYFVHNIHPAAKEQRDLLFAKMKKAGYEWNAEKKELKKISQKMVSAEAKEALYDKPTDEEMKELLRTEYEKGRADTIAEMEKDWSEEDEVKINRIVACLENINVADNDILLKDVDWLKSLKDRFIPKPKHEWSIEDERTIAIINNALTESNTPPDDYDKVYDWLESIKQRIGWKPSNAQIEALEHFVKSIGEGGYASPYDNKTKLLYSLLEQLKKLKE